MQLASCLPVFLNNAFFPLFLLSLHPLSRALNSQNQLGKSKNFGKGCLEKQYLIELVQSSQMHFRIVHSILHFLNPEQENFNGLNAKQFENAQTCHICVVGTCTHQCLSLDEMWTDYFLLSHGGDF